MEVEIIRSKRRKRTISGHLVNDKLIVRAPLMIPGHSLERIIERFKEKFERKRIKKELEKEDNLLERARKINQKYFADRLKINSIQYVTGQNTRFGCCNYAKSDIRISHKVGLMPGWVRDYVVLHEMAHLVEPNHGNAFWEIVNRYKFTERARGFLMACGIEEERQEEEGSA